MPKTKPSTILAGGAASRHTQTKMPGSKLGLVALATAGAITLGAPGAFASTIDPSNIHVGPGAGMACDVGCAGEPNQIGSGNTFDFYNVGGNQIATPTLLILGVPNDAGTAITANSLTGVQNYGSYTPYPGSPGPSSPVTFAFGSTSDGVFVPSGFAGDMTSKQDVYGFLGIGTSANNSNSFTNWMGADAAIDNITATEFGIYVFQIDSGMTKQSLLNFDASLPLGTFIVGYGLDSKNGAPNTTPFTEAGLTSTNTTVPEPTSLALLGTALAGLGLFKRRRQKV